MRKIATLSEESKEILLTLCNKEMNLLYIRYDRDNWKQYDVREEVINFFTYHLPTRFLKYRNGYSERELLIHKLSLAEKHTDQMDRSCIVCLVKDGGNSKLVVAEKEYTLVEGGIYVFNDFLSHSFSSERESVLITYGAFPIRKYR